jgi:hypothetical protein
MSHSRVPAAPRGALRIGVARERAVARACGQAVGVAHMAAHARGAAHYALKVVALTHADDPASAVALEDEWQRRQPSARFSDFVYPPQGT